MQFKNKLSTLKAVLNKREQMISFYSHQLSYAISYNFNWETNFDTEVKGIQYFM